VDVKFGIGLVLSGKTSFMHVLQANVQAIALEGCCRLAVAYGLHLIFMEVTKYQTPDGKIPLDEWLAGLRDKRARSRIAIRLDQLALGLLGDWKPVGDGVCELRVDVGAGYRIYYGRHGHELVILFCGGDKGSQQADIRQAIQYWNNFKVEKNGSSTLQ
jgi:putative addiction module killer protein